MLLGLRGGGKRGRVNRAVDQEEDEQLGSRIQFIHGVVTPNNQDAKEAHAALSIASIDLPKWVGSLDVKKLEELDRLVELNLKLLTRDQEIRKLLPYITEFKELEDLTNCHQFRT